MTNPISLTKRQHYHMRAVLKNFSVNTQLSVSYKDGEQALLDYDDKEFYGFMAWSDETETGLSWGIERKAQGQIRHILNTKTVSNHTDISNYHLLWRLRHLYALRPEPSMKVFDDFGFGNIEEVKDWANRNHKIYINGDGTVDSIFATTLRIKESLEQHKDVYGAIYWQLGIAEEGGLISADSYKSRLIFPLSPNYVLVGKREKLKAWAMTSEEIRRINNISNEECMNFTFARPGSPFEPPA